MNPADNDMKNKLKNLCFKATSEMHDRILADALQAQEESSPNRPVITKRLFVELAAAAVLILAVSVFVVHKNSELKQQRSYVLVAIVEESPAGLNIISINRAFRQGDDMEALEELLEKAGRRIRPVLNERLTIDQLLCELEDCEEFSERNMI